MKPYKVKKRRKGSKLLKLFAKRPKNKDKLMYIVKRVLTIIN